MNQVCLVLGASGFLGRNLCRKLAAQGHHVLAYGKDGAKLRKLFSGASNIEIAVGDFVHDNVAPALLDCADVVFHLISTTRPVNKDVLKEFETNVVPTIRLLDACASRNVRFVYFSSGGTIYGVPRYVPIDEDHRTDPISAYGIHKLSVEKCMEYYGRTYGLDYSILRISNPYGRFQAPFANQGVIAVFMAHAILDKSIDVWGDGTAVRDYIYVDDVMEACIRLLDYQGDQRIFNIGSGKGYSLQQIICLIEQELQKKIRVRYQPSRIQDVPSNVLECRLAERELAWKPVVPLTEGIHAMHMMWDTERMMFA